MYKHLALAAAASAVFSLQALAAGTQLTVYTALEAEQLKSYKPVSYTHLTLPTKRIV